MNRHEICEWKNSQNASYQKPTDALALIQKCFRQMKCSNVYEVNASTRSRRLKQNQHGCWPRALIYLSWVGVAVPIFALPVSLYLGMPLDNLGSGLFCVNPGPFGVGLGSFIPAIGNIFMLKEPDIHKHTFTPQVFESSCLWKQFMLNTKLQLQLYEALSNMYCMSMRSSVFCCGWCVVCCFFLFFLLVKILIHPS